MAVGKVLTLSSVSFSRHHCQQWEPLWSPILPLTSFCRPASYGGHLLPSLSLFTFLPSASPSLLPNSLIQGPCLARSQIEPLHSATCQFLHVCPADSLNALQLPARRDLLFLRLCTCCVKPPSSHHPAYASRFPGQGREHDL